MRVSGASARLRDARRLLGIFGAILAVALFIGALQPGGASGARYVGAPGPDFVATGADGSAVRLSDLRGRPVWLTFFSTWCVNCRAEDPDIDRLVRERRDAGSDLAFLAVGVGETPTSISDYVRTVGLSYPWAADPQESASRRYAVLAYPTHVFLDRQGVVRDVRIGTLHLDEMRQLVAALETPR
ncbi:MAG: TlpA family protein disulfide reductase [Chloroflexota bacterium]|nr:TlpA family protein disulfide reductase [Chloroflexota bacterium]